MIANILKQFIARFYYLDLCPKAHKLTYLQTWVEGHKTYSHVYKWWPKILDIA